MIELPFKTYNEFYQIDPYNLQNKVGGYISRESTEYYGALVITKINETDIKPQLIMGTPKIHYPFDSLQDGTRKYKFPVAKEIDIFEKLDGTNILAFSYTNGEDRFYSYKTRLLPFINAESKWGNFFEMWNKVAEEDFCCIEDIIDEYQCNLSFELYGARNPHLVVYEVPLAYSLLFGVTNTGNILSPLQLKTNLPSAKLIAICDKDYQNFYIAIQDRLQHELKIVDENTYSGMEGTVWYLKTIEGRIIQYKCKPETIETIHFSQGKGISKNAILATCWNALENTDRLTIEFIKQLLSEEFDSIKVEANHYLIEKCIAIVEDALIFRDKVLSEYKKIGIDIKLDKANVMRKLSEHFSKNLMGRVYSIIVNWN